MVEPVLYFVLGALVAGVVALFAGQAVWSRAVRLTTRRVLRQVPVSRADLAAAGDLVRAEHAVLACRLERRVNVLNGRVTEHLANIGRQSVTIQRLRAMLAERQVEAGSWEAREHVLHDSIERSNEDLDRTQAALAVAEQSLKDIRQRLEDAQNGRREAEALAQTRGMDMAVLEAEVGVLRKQTAQTSQELESARAQLEREIAARAAAEQQARNTEEMVRQELASRINAAETQAEVLRAEKAMLEGALSSARAMRQAGSAAELEGVSPLPLAGQADAASQKGPKSAEPQPRPNKSAAPVEPARMRSRSAARGSRRVVGGGEPRS